MKKEFAIKQELKQLKPWLLAARPKTLPISLAPVLAGTLLAKHTVEQVDWILSALAFLSALFIQAGTNLVNDALDCQKGADTQERLGPNRMTQAGLLSFQQVLKGGFFCFALAILLGIPLILAGGWPFLVILLVSVTCGYLYTGGPAPLAYHGLGEPFIFIFYGLVATPAVYYLQTHFIDGKCFLAAVQMGLLAMVPNAINNLRDIRTDAQANKKTLAVRFGRSFACLETAVFSLIPFILGLGWFVQGMPLLALFPLIGLPLAYRNVKAIWLTQPGSSYHDSFGHSVLTLFLFALSLSGACLLT